MGTRETLEKARRGPLNNNSGIISMEMYICVTQHTTCSSNEPHIGGPEEAHFGPMEMMASSWASNHICVEVQLWYVEPCYSVASEPTADVQKKQVASNGKKNNT